ncbi:unnamed protein product [Rotaria sordida]|uniref:Uncharacterized protein n=1 Tax=Rotaria sordida TaxID=392033 RepID=A0A814FBQ0_9BILA|nr:unnamed protein product [Rotaria sordida]CAF4141259.1 unnamed protein product [Rotaria sordida]
MSAHPITVIACDIGGVIKDQRNDEPIENAVKSVIKLSENTSNMVIFISKCKDSYKRQSNMWLEKYNLSHIRAYYCLEYEEKVKIANDNNVNVMIDDRMQVLRSFPSSIIKIWFCSDPKKIEGARKFQPDFINSVRIAQSWEEILELIEEIQT